MKLKRFFSLLLSLTVTVGAASFSGMTAKSATTHPNADKYFYFCIEYTDYDGDDESKYYSEEYPDKCRIMNPVKVYEDGFYNVGGEFISFTDLCGNLIDFNENIQQYWKDGIDNVHIDSVADAVDLILTYYSDSYIYGCPLMTDSDNCGLGEAISLSEYGMSEGYLQSLNCDMGEFSSGEMAFFAGITLADYGMGDYKWSNDTLSGGDVFRLVCDWNGFVTLMSYEATACDDLVQAVGDYYEQKTKKIDGIDEADEAYAEALAGWFSDDVQALAENLKRALPGMKEETASVGEISVKAYPQDINLYAKGNKDAYLSAWATGYTGMLTYQWYRDGKKIDGATNYKYYLKDEPVGKHTYRVDVTATISTLNTDIKSLEKEMTVYNAPTVSLNGESKIFVVKDKELSLSVQATCDTELYPGNELKYQWYSSAYSDAAFAPKIDGETNSSLKLTPTEYDTSYYYAVVTDSGSNSVRSEIIQVTVIPTYDENGWDGTFDEDEDEPELIYGTRTYSIGTPEELAWYADYVNGAIAASSNKYCDVYGAVLTADIDLNSYPWTPIGSGSDYVPFNFTFDGNGHTIKNLYCNKYTSGLFGAIGYMIDETYGIQNKYCYIKNLTVEGYSHGSSNSGLVAGKATCTYFDNVTVKGNSGVDKTSCAGGIAGSESGCKFTSCINYADICAKSENGYSGGIAGCQESVWACTGGNILKDNTQYLKTVIKNCINLGKVTGSKNSGAMLGYITHYDNDFGNYDSYKYTNKDPSSFGYDYCIAVEFENNLTLSAASAITLSAKKTMTEVETAKTVDVSECTDGKCGIDIFKNGLTASNFTLTGDVTAYINNKNDNITTASVILALYDTDGRMLEIKALPKKLNAGHNLAVFRDLSVKHTGDYKIKLMLWNDLSALVPLSNTAESEITNN